MCKAASSCQSGSASILLATSGRKPAPALNINTRAGWKPALPSYINNRAINSARRRTLNLMKTCRR